MSEILMVSGVRRAYPGKVAVDDASLSLTRGRITCLLGPSGCGKSTLLRLIAGLEPVDAGEVRNPDRVISAKGVHVAPERRDIGFVFQDYALFPHLTVEQNVGFGLRKMSADERKARIAAQLDEVRLTHKAKAYPQALSGGEQQRVALARALARQPGVILLDEPFSGLDGQLKTEVRNTALKALRDAGAAALIVTHDAEEAMMMADDLALMLDGHILQTGSPRDCYVSPVSPEAGRLLGDTNLLDGRAESGKVVTAFGEIPGAGARVMARPEGLVIGTSGARAAVTHVAFAGATVLVTLEAGGQTALSRIAAAQAPKIGDAVKVSLDPAFCAVFA
jgi:iron(III) transport system ATP-binding protein